MSEDFYLGHIVDPSTGDKTGDKLLYDPNDLTTHAVIVGMTGSGKTGLCLDLIEEAALNKVPALMIDLKGDITNAVLHFPNLAPADFEPWVNADDAQRSGKTTAEVAESTANLWKNGLAGSDIGPDRLQALKDSAQFAIYTPGSDAGLPISILSSLAAPDLAWAGNEESLRERISSTVTALLGLIGMTDIDPIRSREHILLSNIFENSWSQAKNLDLGELIMQVQNPPFEKLGVFDVKQFFPDKDRFDLAISLNSILASPAFQSWIKGEPLDIQNMLYMPDGQPRHTIFYLAHLSEDERMFFVTLLYGAVETWMRAQSGTSSLRAIVYFDEIFGYLPPVGNPPSKEPMLRMLKQARAFGVGQVLATQNPVDVDYKALSNAGTWFIGKLGTEQDKARLLDGLETAMANSGALDKREYDKLISGLGKRVFLLRNVHEKKPVTFGTRWAMNYLAGPMTRTQIPALNELAGATANMSAEQSSAKTERSSVGGAAAPAAAMAATQKAAPEPQGLELPGSSTKPAVPGRVQEYFLPVKFDFEEAAEAANRRLPAGAESMGIVYRPVLLAKADVRYNQRKYNVNMEKAISLMIEEPDRRGFVDWDDYLNPDAAPINEDDMDRRPDNDAHFGELEAPLSDSKLFSSMKKDFVDWAYRGAEIMVRANEALKVFSGPDIDQETFEKMCAEAAKKQAMVEYEKVSAQYDKKIAAVEKKLAKEERELEEDEADLASRRREEGMKHVETVFGMVFGRKRSMSSSMTKRRMTSRAKAAVEESKDEIVALKKELEELEDQKDELVDELDEKWLDVAEDVTEIPIQPYKKDILVDLFGVGWLPYHVIDDDGRPLEFAAFG
ncbi:MAG: DUF87 domain-containing protein [Anaerolineae bacterium]